MYWTLWSRASKFSDAIRSDVRWVGDVDPYDRCATLDNRPDTLDTNWTFVFTFNAYLYLGLTVLSIFILFGAWVWPMRVFGFIGHCLGSLAHIAGIVLVGYYRYTDAGSLCAQKDQAHNQDGDTFEKDADLMQDLFIS